MKLSSSKNLGLILAVIGAACLSIPAHAQTFNGSVSDDYSTAGNWTPGTVPDLSTGATAIIANGDAVTYDAAAHGDFIVSNGGTLEISSGSWTQSTGGNWMWLGQQGNGTGTGNGHVLVNGGTFIQGNDTNNPFQIVGTGNSFTISSGAAYFDEGVNITQLPSVMSWTQTGGTVNILGTNIELNINSGGVLNISGTGNFNMADLMNIQSYLGNGSQINFSSSGTFYDGAANYDGWYAPGADDFNFLSGTTGTLEFNNDNLSEVQGWVNDGYISLNDTTSASSFTVSQSGDVISVMLTPEEVPEPSTYALLGLGLGVVYFFRRKSRFSA